MKGVWTHSLVSITAYESDQVLSAQPPVPLDTKTLASARKLQLADPKTHSQEDIPVEILIGGDHYWKLVKDSPPKRISTSAVLDPTTLGWIGTFIHKDLATCTHVFLRQDGARRSLQPPYSGPPQVEARTDKTFTIVVRGRHTTVSTDRVKPAYFIHDDLPDVSSPTS